jgi:hypothetical protein
MAKTQEQPNKSHAIHELTSRLDEASRRDFIAFTLRQRQRHLHRLFLAVSRRAYLARLEGHKVVSFLAKEIKQRGHEDEELCRNAAEIAKSYGFTPRTIREAEALRAAELAAYPATLTADDIGRYRSATVTQEAAAAASGHALLVVTAAYMADARASGRLGLAVASANAQAAVDTAQDAQLKWLKERLGQGRQEKEGRRSLLRRVVAIFRSRPMRHPRDDMDSGEPEA